MSRHDAAVDPAVWTIWILAGGRSSRMGRDKSRIVASGRTLLAWVRLAAAATGWPVRTIRTDAVPRCGPLGGVVTGLRRARGGWCLFLSCDMPLVTPALLQRVMTRAGREGRAVFVRTRDGHGFPFALRADQLVHLEAGLRAGERSLQRLAQRLWAGSLHLPAAWAATLANVNTPADLVTVRRRLRTRAGRNRPGTL